MQGVRLVRDLWRDLCFGARMFRKNPGFAFLAVLCLALGIGVNTSIFTLLDLAYLRPLPVPDADFITILSRPSGPLFSYPEYAAYHERNQCFTEMAASMPTESSLDFAGTSRLIAAEAISPSYIKLMGVRAALGRWFTGEYEPVAVISYEVWERMFNGDRDILGKVVRSETQWYTIVGVSAPGFTGVYAPIRTDLWVPLRTWARQYRGFNSQLDDRSSPHFMLFGKLRPGVTPGQASVNLNIVDETFQKEAPAISKVRSPLTVERVRGVPNPNSRKFAVPVVTLLAFVVAVVLLIACVNVGNLLLARGVVRRRELSIRVALGASHGRLLRQLLTETLLLALMGTLGGILLGAWTNRLLNALLHSLPMDAPLELDLSLDYRVFLFALALAVVSTLFCGLFPAWRSARVEVFTVLKGDAPSGFQTRTRQAALMTQVGLSLVLLLCAGLFLRSMDRLSRMDPGFAVQNRLLAMTYVSPPEFNDNTGGLFYARALEHLRATPGVRSATLTRFLPLMITGQETDCVSTERVPSFQATLGVTVPGFFQAMEVPVLQGRDFGALDTAESPKVVLVNQTLARRLWSDTSPLGQRLNFGCRDASMAEVVGVVHDTKVRSLGDEPQPHFYRPFAQRYTGLVTMVVQTAGDPSALIPTIRSALLKESAGLRIYSLEPLSQHIARSYYQIRWEASLLFIFGVLALLLAAVGLYGVMASHVAQRTHEIGVRIALGARPGEVYRLVLMRGLKITLFGIAGGLAVSFVLSRVIARFLSGLSPTDSLTFVSTTLLWLIVAFLACYVPACRAMAVDPIDTLRHE